LDDYKLALESTNVFRDRPAGPLRLTMRQRLRERHAARYARRLRSWPGGVARTRREPRRHLRPQPDRRRNHHRDVGQPRTGGRSMSERIRVVVVDDHPLFRAGVVQAVQLDKTIEVVAEGSSGVEAITLVRKYRPDVILLDI